MARKPFRVIDNCQITRSYNVNVLRPFIESESDPNFRKFGSLSSGVDLEAEQVFAALFGVVLQVGEYSDYPGKYCMTIQYDNFTCVRYGNLKTVMFQEGDPIQYADHIGDADGYVHVELCTRYKDNNRWPVYIQGVTWYKKDPMPFVDDTVGFPDEEEMPTYLVIDDHDFVDTDIDYPEEMLKELMGDGKGGED